MRHATRLRRFGTLYGAQWEEDEEEALARDVGQALGVSVYLPAPRGSFHVMPSKPTKAHPSERTLESCAAELGISRTRVGQIEGRATRRLKNNWILKELATGEPYRFPPGVKERLEAEHCGTPLTHEGPVVVCRKCGRCMNGHLLPPDVLAKWRKQSEARAKANLERRQRLAREARERHEFLVKQAAEFRARMRDEAFWRQLSREEFLRRTDVADVLTPVWEVALAEAKGKGCGVRVEEVPHGKRLYRIDVEPDGGTRVYESRRNQL